MTKLKHAAILFIIAANFIWAQNNIEFSGETINNEEIKFSEALLKGPVLVNFWALWCKPCRAEIRHLQLFHEKYSEKGLTVLGINQDSPRSIAKVKSFASSHGLEFPVITDPNNEIFQQFNGQSIPLNLLYNSKGELVYSHVGYLPGDEIELENEIKKVLSIEN